jgi:S-adenosyl-L-methionine hydrolase (adenosine-forming)
VIVLEQDSRQAGPIITLTTDFGVSSPYVAAMKGVILSINPAATIIDISHAVPAQDIAQGALVLEDTTPWFPSMTIHVAVVDPGVGTERSILYARIGGQQYIAPDNGLLGRLTARTPPTMVLRLSEPEFWLAEVSNTFHGRDVMAPVAAHLSMGLDPLRLGPAAGPIDRLDVPLPHVLEGKIHGTVIAIDSFGNLITNISHDLLAGKPNDNRACVVCGIYETNGIYKAYGQQAPGMLVALIGSSGRLELAIVGDNAARRLGVAIGTPVAVAWE